MIKKNARDQALETTECTFHEAMERGDGSYYLLILILCNYEYIQKVFILKYFSRKFDM